MNGLQQLIDTWELLATSGEFSLYTNPTITLPSYMIVDPTPSIVSLEVFRAMGYQPPFADQPTAEAAMEHLVSLGGTAAIPGILAQGGSVPPTAPIAPIVINPLDTSTLDMVPVVPAPQLTAALTSLATPEPVISHELLAGMPEVTDFNTIPYDDLPGIDYGEPTQPTIDAQADLVLVATMEPMIVTPIVQPIPYPTSEDHAGLPHSDALAKLDQLVKLLTAIEPVAADLRGAVATMAVNSISTGPIGTADPGSREMPSIARSTKAEGFNWYLMIGPVAALTEMQAIEQQTTLLKNARFTRTPKLDPPGSNDVEGFGEVWYSKISDTQAARLAWMDGAKLPVHNM
jgi:hypothetical protein